MQPVKIDSMASLPLSDIVDAFRRAFADYAVEFSQPEIERMLTRRGFNPDLSFAAFCDGVIVSFLLNGTGRYNGVETCYDCGTGTVAEFRGQHLASRLFDHALPFLRQGGIKNYLLEVLKENQTAINLYSRSGFSVTADYICFNTPVADLTLATSHKCDFSIKPVSFDMILPCKEFADFEPSWQNSFESLSRGRDNLIFMGAFCGQLLVGYAVADPDSGDISQIAVAQPYRRKGIASALLASLLGPMKSPKLKVINVDKDAGSLIQFLGKSGFKRGLDQFAMQRSVDSPESELI